MEHFKIVIQKGDFSIEISSHEKDWVENKILEYKSVFEDIEKFVSKKKEDSPKSPEREHHNFESISINEFYKKFISGKINSRPEIVTFFVYYLGKSKGQKEFTSTEIKEQFREVGYPGWNSINIADTLNQAKKRAFLNNFNNQWSLSLTGEDFVLNKIANEN